MKSRRCNSSNSIRLPRGPTAMQVIELTGISHEHNEDFATILRPLAASSAHPLHLTEQTLAARALMRVC